MASYNELNALIDAYINRNGVQAITGQILNGVLKAMVEQIGRGYAIMGVADLATDPGTPDAPESWFASTPGTYTNFGGLVVADAEFAIFSYTPQTETWEKTTLTEGIKQIICATHENGGHIPNVVASYEDGVLTLDFYNLQGLPGENATIDQVTANLVEDGGQPDASVATYGTESTKNFAFTFKNLKGDKGDTGVTSVVATVDNTTGTPTCTVSLVGQQLTLAFSGLKGAQGDTGSSVDYPFTIVNNLTTDDATQALSAAQGVVLQGKITQLEHKVDVLPIPNIGKVVNLVPFADGLSVGGLNDSTGAEATNNARLRTGYIPVADTKFFKARTGNWDCEVLCYKYENGAYSYLGYTHYLVDGTQEYKAGTTHIRLYIMNSQDSSPKPSYDVSDKLFIADENGMLVNRKDISGLLASEHTQWIIPSLNIARGYAASTFWNYEERQDSFVVRIPITGGQTIKLRSYVGTDATARRTLAFRADGVRLDYYNGQATERSINIPANTAYMDFTMDLAHINDVYVKDSNGNYLFKYSQYGEIQTRHNQTKIRIGQWNVGAWDSEYYYEGGTTRKETHTTDELIALLRGIFTEMQADIVILNEYKDFLDSAKTASAYEQVLRQFYPYIKTYETITTAPKLAVASRFPLLLSNQYVDNSVRALVGNIDIGFHNRIGFIATHLSAADAATRITQAGLIASLIPGFKYGICGGDMNTGNNGEDSASISAQITPFINAGYTPANRGYWGAKVTYYQPQVALDNIYARGINVVNYKVLDSRPGSDHFPTYADLTLWE